MKIPGKEENPTEVKAERRKRRKIQCIIFLVLFLALEVILRLFGMKAGSLIDDFKVQDHPVFEPRFVVDSNGINYLLPNTAALMLGTVVNPQGFRSSVNYTRETIDSLRKATGKKIVMIIGDSFVEGCCADTVTNSFPDLLEKNSKYIVLNMGIAGTDPLQYKLIAQKFVKLLKPDIVVTAVYFGNDIISFKRNPAPGVPLTFPFKDNKWIYSVAPNHLSRKLNYSFKSAEEAYRFYIENYTLHGENRNWLEKTIKYSVCFSKLYLAVQHQWLNYTWRKENPGLKVDANQILYEYLKEIKTVCERNSSKPVFVGIPAPREVSEDMQEKYKDVFKDIRYYTPNTLTANDYDGMDMSNHLNNGGHAKYAVFLASVIEKN